ncbi:MAG: N-acetyltransferase, partial [Bauldia sp.]
MTAVIRPATVADLPAILAIYNDAVLNTTAIWNEALADIDNRLAWFEARARQNYPVLVAEMVGAVVGYGSFGDFRPFDGYRHSVENSIYVDPGETGRGIGRKLLGELIAQCTAQGFRQMIAVIG